MGLDYRVYTRNGLNNESEHGVGFHEEVMSFEDFALGHIALGRISSYLCDVLCTFKTIEKNGAGVYVWATAKYGTGDYLFVLDHSHGWTAEQIVAQIQSSEYSHLYLVTIDAIEPVGCSSLWMRSAPKRMSRHSSLKADIAAAMNAFSDTARHSDITIRDTFIPA